MTWTNPSRGEPQRNTSYPFRPSAASTADQFSWHPTLLSCKMWMQESPAGLNWKSYIIDNGNHRPECANISLCSYCWRCCSVKNSGPSSKTNPHLAGAAHSDSKSLQLRMWSLATLAKLATRAGYTSWLASLAQTKSAVPSEGEASLKVWKQPNLVVKIDIHKVYGFHKYNCITVVQSSIKS